MITTNIYGSSFGAVRPMFTRAQVDNGFISLDDINDSRSLKEILTVDFLKSIGTKPVVHSNGFIVLNLTPQKRLHIWGHPDIPQKREVQAIHDHLFGFRSFGLAGKLKNIIYELVPDGNDYHIYLTNPREYRIDPSGVFCGLKEKEIVVIGAPDNKEGLPSFYDIQPWDLHMTEVMGPAATVIHKTGNSLRTINRDGQRALCLLPKEVSPNNETNTSNIPEAILWRIIEEVLALNP